MPHPFVIAYHLIWTAYGWWLPNDPRGSTSRNTLNDILTQLGALHFGRKRIQPASREIHDFYDRAEPLLSHDLLQICADEMKVVAASFWRVISIHRYTCYACATMPDHIHILIRKHKHSAEEMIWNLQEESRRVLREAGLRTADHPTWGGSGWKVFLDHPDDIRRTIKYIEDNPLPLRMPRQTWGFVKAYDGWPLHPGHHPNSPYARRLREGEKK